MKKKRTFAVDDMETSKDVLPAHKTQSDEYTASLAVFKSRVELMTCGGVPKSVGTVGPSKTKSDRICGTFIGKLTHARIIKRKSVSSCSQNKCLLSAYSDSQQHRR